MLKRWARFLMERYVPHASPVFLWALAVDLLVQRQLGAPQVRLSLATVIVGVTAVLMGAAARITDEIKDADTDRRFFPERPIVSGRISEREATWLALATVGLSLALNAAWPIAVLELGGQALFLYLMTRWFFVPKLISGNRLLAIGSHFPFYVVLGFYAADFVARYHGLESPGLTAAALGGWWVLPFLSYEFARKAPLPSEEREGLQTYTTLLGFPFAALIGFLLAGAHFALLLAWCGVRGPLVPAVLGAALAAYLAVFVLLAAGRLKKSAPLAMASGAYWMAALILVSLESLEVL